MTLTRKTLIIMGSVFLGLVLLIHSVLHQTLLNDFKTLENHKLETNLRRVFAALDDEIARIDSIVGDWGSWDETYLFVQGKHDTYIQENLMDITFTNLRVSTMLFFDRSERLVFGKCVDLSHGVEIPVPSDLLEHAKSGSLLLDHPNASSFQKGILPLQRAPMMVASRPILQNDDSGPIQGTLMVGLFLDSREVERLSSKTHLRIHLKPFHEHPLARRPDVRQSRPEIPFVHAEALDSETVAGHAPVYGLYNKPALVLSVTEARTIYDRGKTAVRFSIMSILIVVFVAMCLIFLLMQRLILSPLSQLSANVDTIGANRDFRFRLPMEGGDEVAQLALEINNMLRSLETAQKELQKSEERYRAIIEDQTELICRFLPHGTVTFVNEACCRFFGRSRDDMVGADFMSLFGEDDPRAFRKRLEAITPAAPTTSYEQRVTLGGGAVRWLHCIERGIFDELGNVLEYQAVGHDITERKQVEEALRTSERKHRTLLETMSEGFLVEDAQGVLTFVNDRLCRMLGYTQEELVGSSLADFSTSCTILSCSNGRQWAQNEISLRHRSGREVFAILSSNSIQDEMNRFAGRFAVLTDITERRKAEEDRLVLTTAIEQAAESVVITDSRGIIRYVNPAFEHVTGFQKEEAVGRTPAILQSGEHDADFYRQLWETLRQGEVWKGEFVNRTKNGALVQEAATISPIRDASRKIVNYVAVKRDITQEALLEKRLRQTQKLEAIGTLAGGIAHDFNNILGGIFLSAETALRRLPEGHEARASVERILHAGHRAKDLVQQILAFGRQGEHSRLPLKVTPILKEALKLLRASFPSTIEMRWKIPDQSSPVLADPTEIHQIFMNLAINGAQAIGSRPGVLEMRLGEMQLGEEQSADYPELQPGRYLKLTVKDTGCGVDPEAAERIFDPFFTTKGPGEGTGMGLAVVHGIVRRYGGAVTFGSRPGKGSTFTVLLPTAGSPGQWKGIKLQGRWRGDEHILLVDDEEDLLDLWRMVLKRLGYRVTAEGSCLRALETFLERPHAFDMVLTDLTMPQMTGLELARKIRFLRPDIPIILHTGYGETVAGHVLKELNIHELVSKPVVSAQMLEAIRRILDLQEASQKESRYGSCSGH